MTALTGKLSSHPSPLSDMIADFRDDDSGATVIEYALIVSLIFLAIVSAVTNYTNSTSQMYDDISTNLTN